MERFARLITRTAVARAIVGVSSQAAGPARTVSRWGSSASLISQVAEFHR